MGSVNSTGNKLDKALAADLPEDERYFGLENFGNTCYCNSVLQALYFCEPFRRAILDYADRRRHPSSASNRLHTLSPSPIASSSIPSASTSTTPHPIVTDPSSASATPQPNGVPPRPPSARAPLTQPTSSTPESSVPLSLADDTMLTALADLFASIASQKKRTGSVPPKTFVNKLRQENELFSSYMHQDAHEFLNFILNNVVECLEAERRRAATTSARRRPRPQNGVPPGPVSNPNTPPAPLDTNSTSSTPAHTTPTTTTTNATPSTTTPTADAIADPELSDDDHHRPAPTFVHDLFEGQLSNEVRCLCCETITRRVESFFDLSVDVEQNSSLTACLRSFSSTELLEKQDKFFCDACCSLQEAERRMRVKRLPRILALHLKRFKYVEQLGKYKKLSYRVVFPLELRLCNTSDDAEDPDRLYALFAVVVHVGSGPNQGHYVSLIKSHGQWLMFDDDCVEPKDESEIQSVYGVTQDSSQSTEAGYILFYEQISANA